MGTTLLDGRRWAALPRQALVVTLSIGGRQRSGARLTAVLGDRSEAPVHVHSAGMLIVPRIDETITVVAVPDARRKQFDEDMVLHLTVRPDAPPQVDVDAIQLAGRTVSGRTSIDLVTIEPGREPGYVDQLIVRSLADVEVALPSIANRARIACRGALGVDSIPTHKQVNIGCAVDFSASMAPYFADGTVEVATDIVMGVAAVVGGDNFRFVVANASGSSTDLDTFAEFSPRVQQAVQQSGFGVGADMAAATDRAASGSGFTVAIADMPGPLSRQLTSPVQWISFSDSARRYPGFSGAALTPPPPGATAKAFYEEHPHLIEQAVQGLIAPLLEQGIAR